MSEYDASGFDAASGYDAGGPVQLEFVDAPSLNGDDVEWTFRTVGGRVAPSGTVVAQIAVMSHDHNLLGGGTTSIHSELGPHDVGASRIHPLQYKPDDGDYYVSIDVGGDVRYVSYRIHDHHLHAP
jgi:hypothetical protein